MPPTAGLVYATGISHRNPGGMIRQYPKSDMRKTGGRRARPDVPPILEDFDDSGPRPPRPPGRTPFAAQSASPPRVPKPPRRNRNPAPPRARPYRRSTPPSKATMREIRSVTVAGQQMIDRRQRATAKHSGRFCRPNVPPALEQQFGAPVFRRPLPNPGFRRAGKSRNVPPARQRRLSRSPSPRSV